MHRIALIWKHSETRAPAGSVRPQYPFRHFYEPTDSGYRPPEPKPWVSLDRVVDRFAISANAVIPARSAEPAPS